MRLGLISLAFLLAATPAFAQSSRDVSDRMEKLERDLMTLQRQMARGGITPATDGGSADTAASPAQEVRLTGVQEEMRALRGKVEEIEFQNRRLTERLDMFQKEVDLRIQQQAAAAAAPAPAPAPAMNSTDAEAAKPAPKPADAAAAPAAEEKFDQPRDHYNYAFRLLNQTRYDDAEKYFESFTKKYPKDPLIGNAFYWLGETYYIRRNYVKAADNFRQGFETLPKGPKAADNLLKLGMSLSNMKQSKEACIVFGQIVQRFKDSPSVVQKAGQERTRAGCQ